MVTASPTPLLLVHEDGRIAQANERAGALFDYPVEALIGAHIELLIPESVRAHHAELREAFFELPTRRAMGRGRDLFGLRRDGSLIPIEIGLDPVERAGQRWVLVSVIDIAERVNAERRIRMALDAVSNAVVMVDARGTIVLANAEASAMFGHPREALIGSPLEMLVPERYRRRHRVFRTSYANVNQARRMGPGQELFGLRADGQEIPVEIGLTPIASPDGVLIMSTIMDLTERRRHERDTEARNRELSRLNAELSQFAYSASHDLKAPLNSIAGLLSFAVEDLDGGDLGEVRSNLLRAQALAERLAHRIEDVLAISAAAEQRDQRRPIDFAALVNETWAALPTTDRTPPAILHLALDHGGEIASSPTMLASIVENLIGNAVKFSRPEGEARVSVTSSGDETHWSFSVADNGIGIPARHHGDVFKMFRRFSSAHAEGSGLGLALVHKYVAVLGGQIDFESGDDGTTFRVRLPRGVGR